MREFVGDTVLTSPIWNWGPYYVDTVGRSDRGQWETHQFWGGMEITACQLAEYSPKVPEDVRKTRRGGARQAILDGDDVFCGPINDQDGSDVLVADGECMSDGICWGMSVFVEGVEGTADGRKLRTSVLGGDS